MLIDIEGTDGCGKKTQTELLFKYLTNKGYNCKIISFPQYESNSSAPVKMYLGGELNTKKLDGVQISTIFAVDRLITMNKIDIDAYDYIIFDRYVPSNMIHQSANIKDMARLDDFLNWVDDFEYNKLQLPKPDKTLFLDMPVETSLFLARSRADLKNGQAHDILEEDTEHMFKAYNNAKYVANKFNWTTINCVDKELKSIEEIHREILTKLGV